MIPGPLRTAWSRLVRLWRPMAGWSLLVWGTLTAVLTPLSAAAVSRAWGRGGEGVVANEALLSWLFTPAGATWLFVAGGLALVGLALQYAGFYEIVTADVAGESVSLADLGGRLPRKLSAVWRLCAAAAACAILLSLPLVGGLYGVHELLLGARDINYYLYVRPPRWWVALAAAGLWGLLWAGGAGWLVARCLLAVPAYLDGQRPLAAAVRTAWDRTRGDGMRIAALLLAAGVGWASLRAAAGATVVFASGVVVEWAARVSQSVWPMVAATGGAALAGLAVDAAVAFLGVAYLSTLLTKLYLEDTDLHEAATAIDAAKVPDRLVRSVERWLRPRRALPLLAAVLVASAGFGHLLLERLPDDPDVAVTAHRAGPAPAPENTLAGLERSVRAGADWAEIDVQLTRDSVPIVFHDADLMRMTGDARRVAAVPYDTVQRLVQRPDDGTPAAERRIAALSEFLERARGRIGLNIELKYYGRGEPRLAPAVVETIREAGMAEEVLVMSLSLDAVRQVRRLAPEITTGYAAAVSVGDLAGLPVDFLALSRARASPALIRAAGQRGVDVHVWTVNRVEGMVDVIHDGADGIITDRPLLAVRVREELAGMSPASRLLLRFGELAVERGGAVADSSSIRE